MKKVFGFLAAGLMLASPVMAEEAPTYNCDFQPSCEVAPGLYGKISEPVTSKFKLSIGGFVKLDYAYNSVDFGTNVPARAPVTGQIPKPTTAAGRQDQSVFTARQSRLWFKVAGPSFLGAKTGALIEADFYGAGGSNEAANVRMRHAYGTLDWKNTQVLFGQTSDIFGPAVASSVDFSQGSPYGTPNQPRVPQIRVTQKLDLNADNALKLVVGLQNPAQDNSDSKIYGSAVNGAAQVMWISKALGVAPGFYGMSMNSLTFGVFGLYGSQKYTDFGAVDSWGYGAYTFIPVLKSKDGKNRAMTMSLEAQAYMAANMNFNQATAPIAATFTPLHAKGYGMYGQVIFYPVQDLGFTAGYERRMAYNSGNFGSAEFEKSNSNLYANIAYDLNAAVRLAAEYQNLNTQYANNGGVQGARVTGSANVARFAAYYFF